MAKPQSINETIGRGPATQVIIEGTCMDPGKYDPINGYPPDYRTWGNGALRQNPAKCLPYVACVSYGPCYRGGVKSFKCSNEPLNCEGKLDLGEWSRITRRDVRE